MIRREFLRNAAVLASGLAAKISYGTPCPPQLHGGAIGPCDRSGLSNLERRTSELTSSNTPQLGVNYFRSDDGDQYQIANNNTPQRSDITWQVRGIYYDPVRRIMHQMDKQHTSGFLEHGTYDEITNTWTDTPIINSLSSPGSGVPPSHWRQASFDEITGRIYYQKEAMDFLHIYDPDTGWFETPEEEGLTETASSPNGFGYHPNLFGPNKPGVLIADFRKFYGWNIEDETWHTLNTSNMGNSNDLVDADRGEGFYIPDRDELLMTARGRNNPNGPNFCYAIAAGAGLETELSTSNSAELRNKPPKQISAHNNNDKCYACMHPRQPSTVLAFDAANSNVYYTKDAATTPWLTASFSHPFASELDNDGKMTVGTLPYHGVVAGAANAGADSTKFVFWRPPLV